MSLNVSSESPYLANVACMRFFRAVRILENAILVRGSSRSSRSSPGGIHTEGSVPLCNKRPSPSASSLSVLPKVPGTGVHVTHHELRLRRVRQVGHTSGLLNLIHAPIPVAYRLEGNGSAWRERGEEGPDRAWLVIDPPPGQNLAVPLPDRQQRE